MQFVVTDTTEEIKQSAGEQEIMPYFLKISLFL